MTDARSSSPFAPDAPTGTPAGTPADTAPLRRHQHAAWSRHLLNTGLIMRVTHAGVTKLPRRVTYGLGDRSTWLAHRLMRDTTGALVDNFRAVCPDRDEAALRQLARETYRSYARDVIDFMRALSLDAAAARRLFEVNTQAVRPVLDTLLAEGRGVLLVGGHFGNWELGAVMLRAYDYPLTIVAMQEPSETVNRLRLEFRTRVGADTLEVRQSMDTALQIRRRLADNRMVAMLMDRHIDRDRIAVTFFGRRAFFLRTPALLAYLTGAPILPVAVVRREGAPFALITGEPIHLSRDEPRDVAVARAAQAFATQLEGLIRTTPQCWYQFYRYWDAQAEAGQDAAGAQALTR